MANENIQELKFQVGEAWKGVYSSSTAYGLANVVQDPTGLSVYRSLKSGNVGHPVSDRTWWFCIIDMSSIKTESDRIAALNDAIARDEALRVAAEELRQQHEAQREAAETQRNEAEQARISAEQSRVNAESARATAEQQRITAEQGRVSAESARVQAEQARVLAETLRANAEDQRAANEQNRVAAEQQRIERAEQDHQRAESDHATYVDSLGAFDISSYHATDGVLAKYADLTAALGTNGANIPDDLRKGGMSVKFVQSSDNKYVQYRLMSDSFNTTPANWQGVDEEITAGSKNIPESNAVANAIFSQAVDDGLKFSQILGNFIESIGIDAYGKEFSNENLFSTAFIKVNNGDTIYWAGGPRNDINFYLGTYDVNGNTIEVFSSTDYVRTISIDSENIKYIRASFKKTADYVLRNGNTPLLDNGELSDINKQFVGIKKDIYVNLSDIHNNIIFGSAINSSGVEVSDDGTMSTVFVPVKYKDVLLYKAGANLSSNGYSLVIYDADKNKIDNYVGTEQERSITVNYQKASYVRATLKKGILGVYLKINGNNIVSNISIEDKLQYLCGNVLEGKAVYVDGFITDDPNMVATDEIKVKSGDVVEYLACATLSTYLYGLVAYNYNNIFIDSWAGQLTARTITIPDNTAYIRATFLKGANYGLKVNGVNVLKNGLNIEETQTSLSRGHLMPINIFGDVLPPSFKQKYLNLENDLLIAIQGDSLTGLIETCEHQPEPEHCPPGCQYKSWLYLLQENISKEKPVYDRVDSKRSNVDVFTKTGTWQNVVEIGRTEIYAGNSTNESQRSISALTFQCPCDDTGGTPASAALSFEFDASSYQKCNIVISKEPDAVQTKIVISEGNGKMLVSEDRTNWVEANNFTFNQRSLDADGHDKDYYNTVNDYYSACANAGIAVRQPQRRLWMKKASDSVTGIIHISYQRDTSVSYGTVAYMYVWGIEKYNDNAIIIDNLGRGGATTGKLGANITDIFDRHPDLTIYEMPLANEVAHSNNPLTRAELKGIDYYGRYFISDAAGVGALSYKQRSDNYTTLPLIIVLPHTRATYFNAENNAIKVNNAADGEPNTYTCGKQMYSWLKTQLSSYNEVKFINLCDPLINEALVLDNLITKGLYGVKDSITADSIHLSQYGAYLWRKYLAGIFDAV